MLNTSSYKICIDKQRFKFAAAHMTVFPNKTKENLHGHNYKVSLSIHVKKHNFEDLISFKDFKRCLEPICEKLDEKILIAQDNPYSVIRKEGKSLFLEVFTKKYMFPADEVELLPLQNITTEYLAEYIGHLYLEKLNTLDIKIQQIEAVETTVGESFGQQASYRIVLSK